MSDLAVLAGGLTLRGRRALLRIGDDWTQEGAPGPKREDAYSLWWGRSGKLGLIESPRWEPPGRWFYRLTPLGMQLQRFLSQEASQ